MAQLPPKIPTMLPSWPDFSPDQKLHSLGAAILPSHHAAAAVPPPPPPSAAHNNGHPSWVDEFLDFSSTRRGTHRRSVSDSIAFLETPMLDDCRAAPPAGGVHRPAGNNRNNPHDFDKFDDDQFMSMFSDDISNPVTGPNSSSNPSTPSDHNSFNEEKEGCGGGELKNIRSEADEAQSPCDSDSQQTTPFDGDRIVDPKRVKRILANRQSAQRSRVRKLQYISELERSVTSLQTEVSVLSPRVAFLDHQRLLLNVDNSAIKQRIAALAQDKIFKDAHQEALKREIERLRQVYHHQQKLKTTMENSNQDDDNSNSVGTQHQSHNSERPTNNITGGGSGGGAEKEQQKQLLQV
ncbi:unnamed protein product [Linum trigynum]|uniref:BZIP domain-containing protein n=1 Tax=Linum trigynum TaxID=586398 RepID=A0AAV2F7D8_9ROSI